MRTVIIQHWVFLADCGEYRNFLKMEISDKEIVDLSLKYDVMIVERNNETFIVLDIKGKKFRVR